MAKLQRIDEELERAMYASALESCQRQVSSNMRFRTSHDLALSADIIKHIGKAQNTTPRVQVQRVMLLVVRSADHRSTTTWIKRVLHDESTIVEEERLAPLERAKESSCFALRQIAGVDPAWFQATTQHTLNEY